MKNIRWITLAILAVIVTALVIVLPIPERLPFRGIGPDFPEKPNLLTYYVKAKTILSTVNSILLLSLMIIYIDIYSKTRSKFSMGLIMFSIALLLYSLSSNPIIHRFAGFRGSGLGPFTMLPDLFTCIASAILLYLSRQ